MHSFTQITSRIELRGIVPSNLIKVTFIIILFNLQLGSFFFFFLFHIEIEGKCGWIIGGGGGGGGGPTPMKHLNNKKMDTKHRQTPPLFLRL